MGNAVHKQQETLGSHYSKRTVADDVEEDLHARIIGLELDLHKVRQKLAELHQEMADRDQRTGVVLDAYKSIITDLTSVIECQRDEAARREGEMRRDLAALEARLGRSPSQEPAEEGPQPQKTSSWSRRFFA